MADLGRWFKLWCSCLNDPALTNLSLADFGRWVKLGVLIKEQGTEGRIELYPPALALCSQLELPSFQAVIECARMLPHVDVSGETNPTVTFRNWAKYQGDFSTPRVRRHRESETAKKRGEEKRREVPPKPPGGLSSDGDRSKAGKTIIEDILAGRITRDEGHAKLRGLGLTAP